MRMAGPDIVLFAVGALLFGGAVYALALQGGFAALSGGANAALYDVTFTAKTIEAGKQAVSDYTSAKATFNVNESNVTKVTIRIACADPVPAGNTFNLQIRVEAPNGLTVPPKTGACGTTIEIPIKLATLPGKLAATGATPDEAIQNLPADANATRAKGAWTITVNGGRGTPVAIPAGNPSGNIILNVDSWDARALPAVVK